MSFSDIKSCPNCNTTLRGVKVAPTAQWAIGYCDSCNGVPAKCNNCGTNSINQPSTNMSCPSCGEYNASVFLTAII